MSRLSGARLVGGSSLYNREKDDFYATPPESVRAFLDAYHIQGESFYDPCCGQGHICKVLEEYFPTATLYASDLVYRGYGVGGVDFLKTDILNGDKVDWVVSNPPYKYALEFVKRSLEITKVGVAMFLKIQFLEGINRRAFFQRSPLKHVYVFSKRQNPLKHGLPYNPKTGKKWSSTMCFAWFVWEHKYEGEPVVRWL